MKKIITFLFASTFLLQGITAQNTFPSTGAAGIGTITPNASSLLEIKSTTKGLLIPRMTKKQRDLIATPATGLMIYQTNSIPGFYYFDGIIWTSFTSNAWGITGNSGTIAGTNFIGTTDAQALVFKANNKKAGLLDFDVSKANSAYGYQSLNSNTGNSNSAIGYQSLLNNTTGSWNVTNGANTLYTNTTGYFNTATGFSALNKNTTGERNTATGSFALTNNTKGTRNAATGVDAMFSNTTGSTNVANGFEALHNNTTGYSNVAIGSGALYSNTISKNTVAIGDSALYNNGAGTTSEYVAIQNTAIGSKALLSNTTGNGNCAVGFKSLNAVTNGDFNTAIGDMSLSVSNGSENTAIGYSTLPIRYGASYDNTATGAWSQGLNSFGNSNTSYGAYSLYNNVGGNDNTAIGMYADVYYPDLNNVSVIGSGALATTSNQVMLGNTSVMSVWAAGNYMIYSDARFKKNLKENVPGLDFINQLRPVTYNYDIHKLNTYIKPNKAKDQLKESDELKKINDDAIAKKEHTLYTGFVAQEVEQITNKMNYDFSGLHKPENDKDPYGLSYADFVAPLVKAVQELSKINNDKDARIDSLQVRLEKLEAIMNAQQLSSTANIQTVKLNNALLEQNIPNPYSQSTIIIYTLPLKYSTAKIIITDKAGKTIKQINLTGNGKGSVQIDASSLSNGTYHYTLYVNDKMIAGKQMLLVK